MQNESSTVAKSMFSLINEMKQADSKFGYTKELPKSVLSSRMSITVGNIKLMIANVLDGISHVMYSSLQFNKMWTKQMSRKVSVRAIEPMKSSTTCHLLN